nr:uncharacterized protein LOC109177942 [Ipomoea trifida]
MKGATRTPENHTQLTSSLRCFVDAALCKENAQFGFGAIIMNGEGLFVAAKAGIIDCYPDPHFAEFMAIKEALSWILADYRSCTTILSDCLNSGS